MKVHHIRTGLLCMRTNRFDLGKLGISGEGLAIDKYY